MYRAESSLINVQVLVVVSYPWLQIITQVINHNLGYRIWPSLAQHSISQVMIYNLGQIYNQGYKTNYYYYKLRDDFTLYILCFRVLIPAGRMIGCSWCRIYSINLALKFYKKNFLFNVCYQSCQTNLKNPTVLPASSMYVIAI